MAKERLELLALTREELPVYEKSSGCADLLVPVHPLVFSLPQEVRLGEEIASLAVPQAVLWFGEDLRSYNERQTDSETKKWAQRFIDVLEANPKFLHKFGDDTNKNHLWDEYFDFSGYSLRALCITIDTHVYLKEDGELYSWDCAMSVEKAKLYLAPGGSLYENEGSWSLTGRIFRGHNVDDYLQAAMLRNWCIVYNNLLLAEALGISHENALRILGYTTP